jgi:hypothetical protein
MTGFEPATLAPPGATHYRGNTIPLSFRKRPAPRFLILFSSTTASDLDSHFIEWINVQGVPFEVKLQSPLLC